MPSSTPRPFPRALRPLVYGLAFVVPPLMLGLIMTFTTLSELMIHKRPPDLEAATAQNQADPAIRPPKGRLRAAVLVSNVGTEVTDLLAPFEILSESGAFEVYTVAPEKRLAPTTGQVAVLPDYDFATAPPADLLVIPAVLDPADSRLVNWVKEQAPRAKLILSICEGARLAAQAGLLKNRQATSHFLALPQLQEAEPSAHWLAGPRYIQDGNIITSAGVTAALDASLFAVELLAGRDVAEQTATRLSYSWHKAGPGQTALGFGDLLQIFLHGGFSWNKPTLGVLVFPGVSEIGLAAVLDTFPRTLNARVFTLADKRIPIRSRHGLTLVPTSGIDGTADLERPDFLLVPSGGNPESSTHDPVPHRWAAERNIPVKSLLLTAPGKAFGQNLDLISQISGIGTFEITSTEPIAITRLVAKLIEYPLENGGALHGGPLAAWELSLWFRPLLVGLLGIAAAWILERRWLRRFERRTPESGPQL